MALNFLAMSRAISRVSLAARGCRIGEALAESLPMNNSAIDPCPDAGEETNAYVGVASGRLERR